MSATRLWPEPERELADANSLLGRYDLEAAELGKGPRFLELYVPGLSENRPSLMRGDSVLATRRGESKAY